MLRVSKAMVLERFGEPLVPREIKIPELGEKQVLVRITAAGICGSDVHMWTGKDPRTPLPMILGHEGVGEIREIRGEKRSLDGKRLEVGQRIIWNRSVVCGECYWCTKAEQPELCPERWVYGIHRSLDVPPHLNGCYSEYAILDRRTDIFLLDGGGVEPDSLVPVSCSGATVAHAFDLCPPKEGDVVLVQGPGPLGIFAVAFAKELGASKTVVIGGTKERLRMCQEFGATITLSRLKLSVEERKEAILELTDGRGVDLAIEAVGHPDVFREGIDLLRRGGSYLSVGVGAPSGSISLDLYEDIEAKNLRLQGVWASHTNHTQMALDLVLKKSDLFRKLVTHRFVLDKATEALELVRRKGAVKAVLVPLVGAIPCCNASFGGG